MSETPPPPGLVGEILRRIVVTGLLSGGLGLAVYGGAAASSGNPVAPFILALVLCLPLAGLCLWQVAEGWRTGALALWHGAVERRLAPRTYWLAMASYGLCGLALAAIAAWSGWQVV